MDDYELYESQWEAVDVAYRDGNFIGSTPLPGPGAASDAAAADGSGDAETDPPGAAPLPAGTGAASDAAAGGSGDALMRFGVWYQGVHGYVPVT